MLNNKNLHLLQEQIKYKFNNLDVLKKAFIHPSYNGNNDFQTLEFLGDRVLGLVISSYLYKSNEYNLKQMSNVYNYLINTETLCEIACKLNLNKIVLHKIEKLSQKNIADLLETLCGAIYIDSNYEVCQKILVDIWKHKINNLNKVEIINAKTKLQEYSQAKFDCLPEYHLIKDEIVNQKNYYTIEVRVKNLSAQDVGENKNTASQKAAAKLLKIMSKQDV